MLYCDLFQLVILLDSKIGHNKDMEVLKKQQLLFSNEQYDLYVSIGLGTIDIRIEYHEFKGTYISSLGIQNLSEGSLKFQSFPHFLGHLKNSSSFKLNREERSLIIFGEGGEYIISLQELIADETGSIPKAVHSKSTLNFIQILNQLSFEVFNLQRRQKESCFQMQKLKDQVQELQKQKNLPLDPPNVINHKLANDENGLTEQKQNFSKVENQIQILTQRLKQVEAQMDILIQNLLTEQLKRAVGISDWSYIKQKIFLQIHYKNLWSLPKKISDLQFLEKLQIRNCDIKRLPDSFVKLEKLRSLNLQKNKLYMLPKEFGKLKKIKELNLSFNLLQQLPESFCLLSELSQLALNDNRLRELPQNFSYLESLRYLGLQNNKFKQLPTAFCNLPLLSCLSLSIERQTSLKGEIHLQNLGRLQNIYLSCYGTDMIIVKQIGAWCQANGVKAEISYEAAKQQINS